MLAASLATIGQLAVTGVVVGSVYGLVALGFNVIFNATGLINFAQGDMLLFGGFLLYTASRTWELPLVPAVLFAVLVAAAIGGVFQFGIVRLGRGEGLIGAGTALLGVSLLSVAVANWVWGTDPLPVREFTPGAPYLVGDITISRQQIWIIAITGVVVVLFQLFFQRTTVGIAMRAVSQNPVAARGSGISVDRMALLAFVIGTGLAGVGGVLITPLIGVAAGTGLVLVLKGFTASLLGGLGDPRGAMIGGVLLGVIESVSAAFIPSGYQEVVPLLILIVVFIVRPGGVLGVGLSSRA